MNELSFLDLVVLKKVDAESSVEKFGSAINTSFFETANMLGTIKIKGYINIESSIGGASKVTLTDAGNSLLAFSAQRAGEPIEPLDNAILQALASGSKDLESMQSVLNVRSGDLAYHLNKLLAQGFMDYSIRSAKISLMLTEKGFNSTGSVRVQQPAAQQEDDLSRLASELAGDSQGKPAALGAAKPSAEQQKKEAPPWVQPTEKEDIAHILREVYDARQPVQPAGKAGGKPVAQMQPGLQQGAHQQAAHHHKKPLDPEAQKQALRMRRTLSKIEYYAVEYAPYIVLVLLVLAILVGAIFLSLKKV